MHNKINQKYSEIQLELNRRHGYIEANRDHWKACLKKRMEMKVDCVLRMQSQKDEVEGFELHKALDEFVRLKILFSFFDSLPLISMSGVEDNQMDFNAPRLIFPTVAIDDFTWMADFDMENTVETMEHSHQQQIDTDESTNFRKSTGNYTWDL